MAAHFQPLPIDDVLGDIATTLAQSGQAVLVAPPGAGKTTRVPLALLDAPWLGTQKILLLEPRRIAARAAASRMAHMLGEAIGKTVGIRSRLFTRVSAATRVEVITEGVFTRLILADPELTGIGAVLFDEFHERSLDADFGLALALESRAALRPDLRLIIMSATLDGARVSQLLDGAAIIESHGRAFPVETRYERRVPGSRIEDDITAAVKRACAAETGSLLVFLPGQGEIRRVAERLSDANLNPVIDIVPLYGALDIAEQQRAIEPASAGRRKIVLATSIAETSITIEGVRVVIDSGLARVPRYEPDVGITRLETVKVSRAAADQRRGRAGRTGPGICIRLWSEPETRGLLPFAAPEITSADLSNLVLDCAEWGSEPKTLRWLDPPSATQIAATVKELTALGALDAAGRITPGGRRARALPLPSRLAVMVIKGAERGQEKLAAELAAMIVERGAGGIDTDIAVRRAQWARDKSRRASDIDTLVESWSRAARDATPTLTSEKLSPAALLGQAFPDRVAKARGASAPGQFLLANGRAGVLDTANALSRSEFLVVAELQGVAHAARITAALAATFDDVLAIGERNIRDTDELTFDQAAMALRSRRTRTLGAIVLASEPRPVEASPDAALALARGITNAGISRLPWSRAHQQLRDRVAFVKAASGDTQWPDLSDTSLAETVGDWLAPYLPGKTRLSDISADDLGAAIDALVPYALQRQLDRDAPTHFEAPTGNRHAIDYDAEGGPSVSIRVQELFGLTTHPSVAGGRLPLTLNLLSPAHRPIQITRDLPGFWKGSWSSVRSEMRGRYPRHPWPDDPANAPPTSRAKPRGT